MSKSKSKSKTTIPLPHPELWQLMVNIRAKRQTAINREADLVKERKTLEEELDQIGTRDLANEEFRQLTAQHYIVLKHIEQCRAGIRSLADRLDKVIHEASEGRALDAEQFVAKVRDEMEDEDRAKEPETPLFDPAKGKTVGEPDAEKKQADRTKKAAKGTAGGATEYPAGYKADERLNVRIKDLLILSDIKRACNDAGLVTLNDVAALLHQVGNNGPLEAICGPDASKIVDVMNGLLGRLTPPKKAPAPKKSKAGREPVTSL